jgi:TPR repeat protein
MPDDDYTVLHLRRGRRCAGQNPTRTGTSGTRAALARARAPLRWRPGHCVRSESTCTLTLIGMPSKKERAKAAKAAKSPAGGTTAAHQGRSTRRCDQTQGVPAVDLAWIDSEQTGLADHPASQPRLVAAGDPGLHALRARARQAAEAAAGATEGPVAAVAPNSEALREEIEHPCPICLERSEDYTRGENRCLFCTNCGHSICCVCKDMLLKSSPACPQCRARFDTDDETAFRQLTQLLERPPGKYTATALVSIGLRYNTGSGTSRDLPKALACYRKAAECAAASSTSGAIAMYNLGAQAYDEDPGEAMYWFSRAARRGLAEAMVDLGNMLISRTDGVSQGRRLLLAAAEEGHIEAEMALAVHYSNPNEHGDRDFLASYRYISRACVLSKTERQTPEGMQSVQRAKQIREQLLCHTEVQYQLGAAYLAGTANHWTSSYPLLKQLPLLEASDMEMARKWLEIASEGGHEKAAALVKTI